MLSTHQQVQLFTSGLNDFLRSDVELQHLANLQVAKSLARAYEKRTQLTGSNTPTSTASSQRPWRPSNRPSIPLPAGPRPPNDVPSATSPGMGQRPPQSFRHLTPTELANHRSKGLCYNCDEKFVVRHRCKHSFVTYIDMGTNPMVLDDIPYDTEQDPISHNALMGIQSSDTMQLRIRVGTHEFIALVNSGSTHNFSSAATVKSTEMTLSPRQHLTVAVANGERLPCASQRVPRSPASCGQQSLQHRWLRHHVGWIRRCG